jgi:hypothetical protein
MNLSIWLSIFSLSSTSINCENSFFEHFFNLHFLFVYAYYFLFHFLCRDTIKFASFFLFNFSLSFKANFSTFLAKFYAHFHKDLTSLLFLQNFMPISIKIFHILRIQYKSSNVSLI